MNITINDCLVVKTPSGVRNRVNRGWVSSYSNNQRTPVQMKRLRDLSSCSQVKSWWYCIIWVLLFVTYTPVIVCVLKLKGDVSEWLWCLDSSATLLMFGIILLVLCFVIPGHLFPRYIPTSVFILMLFFIDGHSPLYWWRVDWRIRDIHK